MKTQYSVFEDINLDLCDNQCSLSIGTQALKPRVNLFGQIKISRSGIKWGLMLASKAFFKELLGADLDMKLIVILFAGYLSRIRQSLYLLQIKAFKKRSDLTFISTNLLTID